MARKVTIPLTERGHRIGEHHPKSKLTDEQVELIRRIYAEGMVGYRALARAFGCSRYTIAGICRYERRACTPERYKVVRMVDPL